jgi:hypothetical protein
MTARAHQLLSLNLETSVAARTKNRLGSEASDNLPRMVLLRSQNGACRWLPYTDHVLDLVCMYSAWLGWCDCAKAGKTGRSKVALRGGQQGIVWDNLDICPRTSPNKDSRLCTYRNGFHRPAGRHTRSLLDSALSMRCMQRFRMCCYMLPIDTGCWLCVPRPNRFCTLCQQGVLGHDSTLISSALYCKICVIVMIIYFKHLKVMPRFSLCGRMTLNVIGLLARAQKKSPHQLALPWGTRHLISPELAGKL